MLNNLDTTEYYLESIISEGYELRAFVLSDGYQSAHFVARRATLKQIESIHDYILTRGFVTISSIEHEQRILRTYTNIIRLEIIFPD